MFLIVSNGECRGYVREDVPRRMDRATLTTSARSGYSRHRPKALVTHPCPIHPIPQLSYRRRPLVHLLTSSRLVYSSSKSDEDLGPLPRPQDKVLPRWTIDGARVGFSRGV